MLMDGGSSARPGWPGAAAVADVHQAEKKTKVETKYIENLYTNINQHLAVSFVPITSTLQHYILTT